MSVLGKSECSHELCKTRVFNHDKEREEERNCEGKLLRYRRSGSSLWYPAPETPAQSLMTTLADGLDVAKASAASRRITAAEMREKTAPMFPQEPGTIRVTNSEGGVKADGGKAQPRLLMQSMPNAVREICEVLTYGANKYTPDNWKKVEADRYTDALYRHLLAYHAGELFDSETNKHHLAHAACCILFLLEKQNA